MATDVEIDAGEDVAVLTRVSDDMVRIPGGTFRMGSDRHYAEEAPVHRVTVNAFWIDTVPVTNREFRKFVRATGYVTFAEIVPDPKDYPGALPHMLRVRPGSFDGISMTCSVVGDRYSWYAANKARQFQWQHPWWYPQVIEMTPNVSGQTLRAGSLVFSPPKYPVDTDDWSQWWTFTFGANWKRPYGPGSSISGLEDHPVVHVAYSDAAAYAKWAGKDLPTEAEWEFAARGGLDGAEFAWGDEFASGGKLMANTWQGAFPHQNTKLDGYERTSPVTAFPPNGYGVYDMIGDVWEWTADWYSPRHEADVPKACCIPENPRGGREEASYDDCMPNIRIPRKVLKGGSHLCAPNYCRRYRPAARHPEPVDTSASHVGFRCVVRQTEAAS